MSKIPVALLGINLSMMFLVLFGGFSNQTDLLLLGIQGTALLGSLNK